MHQLGICRSCVFPVLGDVADTGLGDRYMGVTRFCCVFLKYHEPPKSSSEKQI